MALSFMLKFGRNALNLKYLYSKIYKIKNIRSTSNHSGSEVSRKNTNNIEIFFNIINMEAVDSSIYCQIPWSVI